MVQRDPGDPSVGEHVPPSQGHAQSSVSGQNITSRVRWLGIHSLHIGQKKHNWGGSKWELPALMGEGASGLLWEPWQKANYCGFSQCYLALLPGGLNPDTATVQMWKQHQSILLMPSSLQYLLMKAELVSIRQWTPFAWKLQSTSNGKALFFLPPLVFQVQKQNPFSSGEPCLCFPMTFKGFRGNSIRICSSFYLCPKTRGAAGATETVEFPQGPSALIAFNGRLTFWSS